MTWDMHQCVDLRSLLLQEFDLLHLTKGARAVTAFAGDGRGPHLTKGARAVTAFAGIHKLHLTEDAHAVTA